MVSLYHVLVVPLLSAGKSTRKSPYLPQYRKHPLPIKTTRPEVPVPPFADCDIGGLPITLVIMIDSQHLCGNLYTGC